MSAHNDSVQGTTGADVKISADLPLDALLALAEVIHGASTLVPGDKQGDRESRVVSSLAGWASGTLRRLKSRATPPPVHDDEKVLTPAPTPFACPTCTRSGGSPLLR